MRPSSTNDAETLALSALAAALTDERRAQRFLALSGIDTEDLRHRAAEPALLAALLRFLEAHEPDLIDVATAVGVEPKVLVAAREELEG
jgi:uncharacterized protein DUF3572